MISEQTEATLRRLLAEQPHYKPTATILKKLEAVHFLCFVGATCMGKTTLMDALVAYNPERYGKTRNFTSRPPREDDDPRRYYYYEHSDGGLAPVLERIATHENLQHNINPYTLIMYGSEIGDYPHPYNLGDIFSSSIDGFRQLGFGELRIFSVVTDAEHWVRRIEERFPAGHPSRQARVQEAVDSLTWSLAQKDTDHSWVISPPEHIETAVTSVDSAIRGETPHDQAEARRLAEECLEKAKELLA
jgi:energy-coupling factor transporter ATP-binding protein EcfA2